MKNLGSYLLSCCLLLSIFIGSCAPIVYSPHAQNEMTAPYNRIGDVHEIGVAPALNLWSVEKHVDTVYLQTYPTASFSFFHNAYYSQGRLGGIGGIELVAFPTTWLVSGGEGFVFLFKPYLGLQYNTSYFTLRLNFSPISFAAGVAGGEWAAGGDLNKLTFYQLSVLLHNQRPSKHIYWIGARNSPAALAGLAGYEFSFTKKHMIRMECSVLAKPPFSLLLNSQELESIKGYVFYMTTGVFVQLK